MACNNNENNKSNSDMASNIINIEMKAIMKQSRPACVTPVVVFIYVDHLVFA